MPSSQRLSRRTLIRRGGTIAIAAAGLALVGCGDDDPGAPIPEGAPAPSDAPAPPDADAPADAAPVPPPAAPVAAPPAPAVSAADGSADSEQASESESSAPPVARRRLMPDRVCDDCTLEDPAFEPLSGARAFFGLAEGAAYRFEIPDNWNGTLILWGRGFGGLNDAGTDFDTQLGFGGLLPGRDVLVRAGVGWAASTYAATGYVPARGVDDLLTTKDLVVAAVGAPQRTYCVGASMGGATAQIMAQEFPDEIDGALALCGALSNAEVIDYLVGWHAIAHWLIGELPAETDAAGMIDWASPLGVVESGVLRLTPRGEQFAALVEDLSGGPRWGFRDGLARQWQLNFALGAAYWPIIRAAAPLAPGAVIDHDGALIAFDTRAVVYGAAAQAGVDLERLNAEILRFRAPAGLRDDPGLGVASGRLDVPLLTVKTTGDLWTPISLDRAYARRVMAAGDGDNLVQRAVRRAGHCNFSEIDEGLRAFFDLVRWVTEGVRPAGEDLSGSDLRGAGVGFTDPFDEDDPLSPRVWAGLGRPPLSVRNLVSV